jgi:hypothetical protein
MMAMKSNLHQNPIIANHAKTCFTIEFHYTIYCFKIGFLVNSFRGSMLSWIMIKSLGDETNYLPHDQLGRSHNIWCPKGQDQLLCPMLNPPYYLLYQWIEPSSKFHDQIWSYAMEIMCLHSKANSVMKAFVMMLHPT